jgi:hypothetical protein
MKKLLFLSAVIAGIAFMPQSRSIAQIGTNTSEIEGFVISPTTMVVEARIESVQVPQKARQDFAKNFSLANDVSWIKPAWNGFVASFKKESALVNVGYKKNGKWMYTVKNYAGGHLLPKYVRAQVKSTYYDHTILSVQEINIPQNEYTIFLLVLQDEQKLITLRVCNGEMDVVSEAIKG